MKLSAVWYDVGYDIQSLNMAVCFEVLIFFWRSIYVLRGCQFPFIAAKNRIVTMFVLVLIILVS